MPLEQAMETALQNLAPNPEGKAMEDEQKRARFQWLRQREEAGTLTPSEQVELAELIHEIESAEAAALRPSVEREEAECLSLEAQNAALAALVQRQENLVHRLQRVLAEAKAERHAIEEEKARILGGSGVASGTTPG